MVSAKKSKSNSLYAGIGVTSIIGIIGFCKLIGIRASSSDLSELWMVILTLAFSAGLIYFMNRFFYRRHTKYTEVTPVRARTAIKTHSFYGADWKALFILFPVMYIILGGFTILFIYGIVVDTLTGVLR
ncbi:hypothetical protein FD35_GL001794 [Furfurilactobacillus rossiae DSM 15814]|uniref:DUF3899 domain-containing protein n=1 Tax=Furfurilactobacillus rossiae DSM 15814 TaxID=1114972 RepID=A0A0R1RF78_9LACO|nr:hypothetical protein FD35_GL001794 [Furfurilactobacillus rossiae DSM 15814]